MALCADANADAVAAIMNVLGREYRDDDHRACSSQPTADQRLRIFCRARAGLVGRWVSQPTE
jgi:hypothetical protein